MADTLQSSRNAEFTPCFCRTHDNRLVVTDGINPSRIWDGVSSATHALGIAAPTVGPTVATPVGGAASAGDYGVAYRYKAVSGAGVEYSSISPVTTATAAANDQFSYSVLTASADTRVTHVEVLRTVVSDTLVYYLDVTVTNGTTTGSSTISDTTLANEDNAWPLNNADGTENLERFDPPVTKALMKACFGLIVEVV